MKSGPQKQPAAEDAGRRGGWFGRGYGSEARVFPGRVQILAYRRRNLSTRPAVSMIFWVPV